MFVDETENPALFLVGETKNLVQLQVVALVVVYNDFTL